MGASSVLNLVVAVADFLVAVLVLIAARVIAGRTPPVILALSAFFAVSGAARLNHPDPFLGYRPWLVTVFDAIGLAVLIVLVVLVPKIARAAVRTVDEASIRALEYERARRDYARLVRHRLFNPLTVVRGAAQTLGEERGLSEAERAVLLEAILDAAGAIQEMTLEPELRPEEGGLDPTPDVESR